MSYSLSKPYKYKDWLVFKDSTFVDLNLSDCNDTVDGICRDDLSLKECVDYARTKDGSLSGYFIEGHGKRICVPLLTTIHKDLNPAYRLRRKDFYPQLKDYQSFAFFNHKDYPYPPELANTVFYEDYFIVENIESGLTIELPKDEKLDISHIGLSDKNSLHIQLLPFRGTLSTSQMYIPVEDKIPVLVNIPGTSLVLIQNEGNTKTLGWGARSIVTPQLNDTFKIHSVNGHSPLYYGDELYITYLDHFLVCVDEHDRLALIHSDYASAKDKELKVTFRFTPKVQAYYCDGQKCKGVSLEETERIGNRAEYKGVTVARNPECWGACKYVKEGTNEFVEFEELGETIGKDKGHLLLYGFGVIVILFILWGVWYTIKRKKKR